MEILYVNSNWRRGYKTNIVCQGHVILPESTKFKISSENVVVWVHTSQKQSNSNFYYIILLGSLPSFYLQPAWGIQRPGRESRDKVGNKYTPWGQRPGAGIPNFSMGNNYMHIQLLHYPTTHWSTVSQVAGQIMQCQGPTIHVHQEFAPAYNTIP